MDDKRIIDLYWERDEEAIRETSLKYGGLCTYIAKNIPAGREDCEESEMENQRIESAIEDFLRQQGEEKRNASHSNMDYSDIRLRFLGFRIAHVA